MTEAEYAAAVQAWRDAHQNWILQGRPVKVLRPPRRWHRYAWSIQHPYRAWRTRGVRP
jgi:hypothetical protein